MKKNICFSFVLLLILSAASPLFSQETSTPPAASPAAEVVAPEFHFDAVPEGTQVKHAYLLKNRGEAPLKVTKVKTA